MENESKTRKGSHFRERLKKITSHKKSYVIENVLNVFSKYRRNESKPNPTCYTTTKTEEISENLDVLFGRRFLSLYLTSQRQN